MQRTACAAIVPFVVVAGCSMAPNTKQPLVQGPSVSIQTGPGSVPEGPAPSSATADCAGITSQQGGGSAYLNCVERHE